MLELARPVSQAPARPPLAPSEADARAIASTLADVLAAPIGEGRRVELIRRALAPLRVDARAARAAHQMMRAAAEPLPQNTRGPAGRRTATDAHLYRAWYLLNAARRIQQGLSEGKTAQDVIRRERTYMQAHHRAQLRRSQSATAADTAAEVSAINTGRRLVVWRAVLDARTTRDCRVMNGKVFDPAVGTSIGYPGSAHPFCRCWSEGMRPGRRYRPVPTIRNPEEVRRR